MCVFIELVACFVYISRFLIGLAYFFRGSVCMLMMRKRVVVVFDLASIPVGSYSGCCSIVDYFISATRRILVDSSNLLKSNAFARWGYYVFDSGLAKSGVDRANFQDFDITSLKILRSSLNSMVNRIIHSNSMSSVVSFRTAHISKALLEVATYFHWEELSVDSPMKTGFCYNAHDETILENEVYVFTCLAGSFIGYSASKSRECGGDPDVSLTKSVHKLLIDRHKVRLNFVDCCWLTDYHEASRHQNKPTDPAVSVIDLEVLLRVLPCTAAFRPHNHANLSRYICYYYYY